MSIHSQLGLVYVSDESTTQDGPLDGETGKHGVARKLTAAEEVTDAGDYSISFSKGEHSPRILVDGEAENPVEFQACKKNS